MVGSNKILTVSYGTFSCTLEGFEDPFVSMKSIAEYFRDLAADDRFFGAEPPQPDVQHLHALAQENSLVPVEAVPEHNGIRLRQSPSDAAPDLESDAPSVADTVDAGTTDTNIGSIEQHSIKGEIDDLAVAKDPPSEPALFASLDDAGDEDEVQEKTAEGLDEDGPKNLFDEPSSESTAVSDKLSAARDAVNAATDPQKASMANTLRAVKHRRGLAMSLTEDDLADATAHPARPRMRPDAFTLTVEDAERAQASSLSAEAEAELMAELAALEADEPAYEDATSGQSPEAAPVKSGRTILEHNVIEREDVAIDRLLAKTNSKLSGDEAQQKRDQLSHLKAAVAATMAERATQKSDAVREAADTPYRDDLAKIVRSPKGDEPQHADPHETDATRPKAAPLILVSGQAAESEASDAAKQSEPGDPQQPAPLTGKAIAPRRIDRNDPERRAQMSENQARFSNYAEEVGAHELTDLLEAAGAFLNTVEGQPVFSRPEVMRMVLRQDEGKRFTREDSLRGFDNLVRKGAIQRVQRGQFTVASKSRFVN